MMNNKAIEVLSKRGEQCEVMKALTLLTQAYISQCGVSLGGRTVVYCAAEPWQEKLAWLDLPLSEMARKVPFVKLMPHITRDYVPGEYDCYDITGLENDELLDGCYQMIRGKEFDNTTLEVLSWGILKATEDEKTVSQEIEATAPDGTKLKGVLEEQKCSGTWLIMTSPYSGLSASKHELIRDPRELLIGAYNDYHRLRQMEDEIRALYPEFQARLEKCKNESRWERHCVYYDVYYPLLGSLVLTSPEKYIEEWFGIKIEKR